MNGFSHEIWQAISLTLRLAGLTTIVLVLIGTPLAWWLARSGLWWKEIIGTCVSLPLVLPPTVIGFYLLIFLGPSGPGGALANLWGLRTLAFSFSGLVLGSVIYSLPFMVQPLRNAFEAIGSRPLEAAATLRATPIQAFWRVAIPMAVPGLLSGMILTFTHTIGEFGVVLMIGGNIPGQTKVLSIAIFDYVETGQWQAAHSLAAAMVVFAFLIILALKLVERRLSARVTP